jgi:hypothetical protein
MTAPKHPGKIIFVDGKTEQITSEENADAMPFTIRYSETEKGLVPVVKIVTHDRGDQIIVRSYGPNDEYLTSTVLLKTTGDKG